MEEDLERLTVAIEGDQDTDEAELAQLTGQLRRRLLELEVESVEMIRSTEVPAEAKSGELIALGMLAVHLVPSVPAFDQLPDRWVEGSASRGSRADDRGRHDQAD